MSINFKLTGLFLLLLLFFTSKKGNVLKNLFYIVLVQCPNIAIIIALPNYIVDFLVLNVGTGVADASLGYKGWGTGSTGTMSVFLFHNFGTPLLVGTVIILVVMLALILATMAFRRSRLSTIDMWMFLLLLFAIAIPIFYLVHVLVYLGVCLYWLATSDGKISTISKYAILIPTLSISFWFFFPIIPFLYLFPFTVLIIKAWSRNPTKTGSRTDCTSRGSGDS
jgi:hypothetical protein